MSTWSSLAGGSFGDVGMISECECDEHLYGVLRTEKEERSTPYAYGTSYGSQSRRSRCKGGMNEGEGEVQFGRDVWQGIGAACSYLHKNS